MQDPSVATASLPRDDRALSLVDNYRSRGSVIDVVNAVGERLWSDGSIAFEPLLAKFPYEAHDSDPRVELWVMEQRKAEGDEEKDTADDVREREGTKIAAWIRAAVDGDAPLTVYDRATGKYRRVQYGDIAILSNTRLPFPAYERALAELGIPFVKDGGREFFLGREVQDLLAAMRVIHNPLDDLNLLAALRSPLFGWGDRDLVRVRVAAGEGRSLWHGLPNVVPNDPTAAKDAYASLRTLRQYAAYVPPVGLIEMICEVTAYRAALLCLPRGRAQVANIDKLIEFARATAELDGPSLASFVHRADLAEKYLAGETDAPIAMTGDDVVAISTIHGAKGLEWPVVFLAAIDSDFARVESTSRYLAPEGALILQYKDEKSQQVRSEGNKALVERAKEREEAEARRQLYVGMTRARERLILSGRYKYPERQSRSAALAAPISWFAAELGITEPDDTVRDVRLGHGHVRVINVSPVQVEKLRQAVAGFRDERLAAARLAVREGRPVEWDVAAAESESGVPADVPAAVTRVLQGQLPAWATQRSLAMTTVTQLVYFFRCPMVYYFDLVLQIDEHPRGRGKSGAVATKKLSALERGTAVHELLERADLAVEPKGEAARLVAQLTGTEVSEARTIQSLLANVLADPLLDRARSASRLEREYRFYLDVGGTTVQGVIDLVFQDADGRGVVVDYKSNDLAAPGRLQTLSELYRPQIEMYALAAKQAGLVEPNEATLYFLNRATAVTTPLDDRRLDIVGDDASAALGKIARGAWDTEPGEKCRGCGYRKRGYCEVGKRFRET